MRCYLPLLILLLPVVLSAQPAAFRFERIGLNDGLPHAAVLEIAQDSLGFMWFSTQDGLCKYDGHTFVTYRTIPGDTISLSYGVSFAMLMDSRGRLWLGTLEGGLNRFDFATEKFYRYKTADSLSGGFCDQVINSLFEDSRGHIWVGTDHCVNVLDPETGAIREIPVHTAIEAVYEDAPGNYWIGSYRDGLFRIDAATRQLRRYPCYDDGDYGTCLPNKNINGMLEDSFGDFWLTSSFNGAFKIAPETYNDSIPKFTRYLPDPDNPHALSNNRATVIFEDSKKQLWIGTRNGLNLYDRQNDRFIHIFNDPNNPHSLSDNDVRAIYEDRQGILWIGTFNGGVNKLELYPQPFVAYTEDTTDSTSLSGKNVLSVWESGDEVWAGTKEGGLNRLDRKTGLFTHYLTEWKGKYDAAHFNVRGLFRAKDGPLWICTNSGLLEFDTRTGVFDDFVTEHSFFSSVAYETSAGKLLIGNSTHHLQYFDKDRRELLPALPADKTIYRTTDILEDNNSVLWLSSFDTGLYRLKSETSDITLYKPLSPDPNDPANDTCLNSKKIHDLAMDRAGNIWLATEQGGLNCFNPKTEEFRHYRKADGLSSDIVYGVLVDNRGFIWAATGMGINKLDPRTGRVVCYDAQDGLPSDSFTDGGAHKGQSGRLYFGSVNGLVAFFPDSISENRYIPPVVITRFLLSNKPVPTNDPRGLLTRNIGYTDAIVLDYTDNMFAFEFAALNYRQQNKNRYAYKMEGVNSDWIHTDAKDRKATFTGLSPGAYVFRVKASNDDGYWNEQGASIRVIINPPWWKTWWAYTFYAVAFLTAGPSFYFWRVNRLKKRQEELERQVTERTAEISQQNVQLAGQKAEIEAQHDRLIELDEFKQGLTGMIVHDLKNPLNIILNALNSHSLTSQISILENTARQMLTMVMNILDVQKFEDTKMILEKQDQGLVEIVENAIRQVTFLSQRKNITITNMIGREITVKVDAEMIERVIVNLLTNGIKYTPNNGAINLTGFQNPSGLIQVEVTDSGEGIPADKLGTVFEKFGQVKAKSSGNVRSTGIGLTFCKLAVEAHGGEIGVKSIVDQGTTFYFSLPAGQKSTQPDNAAGNRTPARKSDRDWALSAADKAALTPVYAVLQTLDVYETSRIEKILAQLEPTDSGSIRLWKNEMQNTLYSLNEEKYAELLALIA